MEQKILSAEPRRTFSNEFKLQMVKLASQPGASVARIAREHDINDNLLFKWLRLWQNEGRISRRLPVTTSSGAGVELLPVEITPDEQKEPMAALTRKRLTRTVLIFTESSDQLSRATDRVSGLPASPGYAQ